MPTDNQWEDVQDVETQAITHTGAEDVDLDSKWNLQTIERETLLLEERVRYMDRKLAARNTLIRKITHDADWTTFGDKVCLSADGAMRIMDIANLPITFHDVKRCKEDIKDDATGKVIGYRWIYEGFATMNERTIQCVGQYSTREAFLGKRAGEWRDTIEINESHIMKAAHTYFKGNCVKDLMGLGSLPTEEYIKITQSAGRDTKQTKDVRHNTGGQGGVDDKQREDQDKLWSLVTQLATLCLIVTFDEEDGEVVKSISEPYPDLVAYIEKNQADPAETYCKASLKALTTWKNKKGAVVKGHSDLRKMKQKQAYMSAKEVCKMMVAEDIEPEIEV